MARKKLELHKNHDIAVGQIAGKEGKLAKNIRDHCPPHEIAKFSNLQRFAEEVGQRTSNK